MNLTKENLKFMKSFETYLEKLDNREQEIVSELRSYNRLDIDEDFDSCQWLQEEQLEIQKKREELFELQIKEVL